MSETTAPGSGGPWIHGGGGGDGTAQAVTCSGGFRLPKLSALVPNGEQLAELLARKEHERGE